MARPSPFTFSITPPTIGDPSFATEAQTVWGELPSAFNYMEAMADFLQTDFATELANGSAAAPSMAFASDLDTGLYRPGANQLATSTGGTRRTLLSNTAFQVDVPITGVAVTQSSTDTTSGRLLKVRDFGLGETTAGGSLADFSATNTPVGFYRYVNTTPNVGDKPAAFSGFGIMQVERYDGNGIKQTITDAIGGVKTAIRTSSGGVFGPWELEYHTGNIVGTVANTGGVNTGAAFEFGSTASGYYQKTADGMLKCWGRFTASSSAEVDVVYPAAFVLATDLSISLTAVSGAAFSVSAKATASSTTGFSAAAWRGDISGTRVSTLVHYTTTGRWK